MLAFGFPATLAATVNQTDRLRGMADHFSTGSSWLQWILLGLILVGVLIVVVLLRGFYRRQQRKEAARKAKARRDRETKSAPVARRRRPVGRDRPPSGPARRP